jgi:phosphatidylserine/phosphatidylglycerophosphate/cardiolipin synthase-like enzyme
MRKQIRGWVLLALGFGVAVWMAGCLAYAQQPLPSGTYYSPETNLETQDAAALGSAHKTIGLAAFSLTDEAIVKVLADRAAHGVEVFIYLDRGELQAECRGDVTCARIPLHALIGLKNVQIRVKQSKVLMHLKSYCVDSGLVRDGSANFSEQGEARQDNSATFTAGAGGTKAFVAKFAAMWARPDNLTVAQAVAGT